jgi:hypothetical protein
MLHKIYCDYMFAVTTRASLNSMRIGKVEVVTTLFVLIAVNMDYKGLLFNVA